MHPRFWRRTTFRGVHKCNSYISKRNEVLLDSPVMGLGWPWTGHCRPHCHGLWPWLDARRRPGRPGVFFFFRSSCGKAGNRWKITEQLRTEVILCVVYTFTYLDLPNLSSFCLFTRKDPPKVIRFYISVGIGATNIQTMMMLVKQRLARKISPMRDV